MLLSRPAILRHMQAGNIVITPFDKQHVGTNSYDVTLGEWYFYERDPKGGLGLFNIWSEKDVKRVWGEPQRAQTLREWLEENDYHGKIGFHGIDLDDRVILIPPGEMFLCHTVEFIGGRNCVTTKMNARSSIGRNFIEVCRCAGLGDVGYVNRWTMEVANSSRRFHIPLVVGRRIAQIVFDEVEPLEGDYTQNGKYQTTTDLAELERTWSPEMMLPRLYKDRETIAAEKRRRDREMIEQLDWAPKAMHLAPPQELDGVGDCE